MAVLLLEYKPYACLGSDPDSQRHTHDQTEDELESILFSHFGAKHNMKIDHLLVVCQILKQNIFLQIEVKGRL